MGEAGSELTVGEQGINNLNFNYPLNKPTMMLKEKKIDF